MFTKRAILAGFASAFALAALPAAQAADDFPAEPIRLIVPYSPGGGTDVTARIVAVRRCRAMSMLISPK